MSTYIPLPAGSPLPSLAGVTVPDDGDDPDAASVNVPIETLVDAVQHLQNKVDPANAVASGISINYRWIGVPVSGTNATVTAATSPDGYFRPAVNCKDGGAGAAYAFAYLLDLPHGSELRQIRCLVYRPGASTTISVIRRNFEVSSGAGGDIDELPVDTVLGTSSSTSAFSGDTQSISATFSAHTIDRASAAEYIVKVSGTAGIDTHWATKCRAWIQFTTLDQGAA